MPRQRSRSPLSPILATESATVRLFFILSVLLCSVNNAGLKTETWLLYCLRLRSRSPHNAKHSTSSIRKGVKSPTSGDAPTDQIPALIPTRLWWGEVGHIIDRCITLGGTIDFHIQQRRRYHTSICTTSMDNYKVSLWLTTGIRKFLDTASKEVRDSVL